MTDKTPLDELQWKNPEWIQAFGLRTDNVLDYFADSPFYDRTSNNQVLKMQSQFNEQLSSIVIENELKKMVGTEFVIHFRREPDFWIVRKQNRVTSDRVEPISDYYIVGANVYMSPNVKDVISSRLLSVALSLDKALNKLQTLSQFTPSDGHIYKTIAEPSTSTPASTSSVSRSKTVVNTPYTPGTPTVNRDNSYTAKEDTLSRATLENLFNISLNSKPIYLKEDPTDEDNGSQLNDEAISLVSPDKK